MHVNEYTSKELKIAKGGMQKADDVKEHQKVDSHIDFDSYNGNPMYS